MEHKRLRLYGNGSGPTMIVVDDDDAVPIYLICNTRKDHDWRERAEAIVAAYNAQYADDRQGS